MDEILELPTGHTGTGSGSEPETKKVVIPRAEIDTSAPFGSVKEAVTRFGGSGSWIPLHLLRLAGQHHGMDEFDIEKMETQTAELEKDLMIKEEETLKVLKELETAKRIVEGLKLSLMKETSSFMPNLSSVPDSQILIHNNNKSVVNLSMYPVSSPNLILSELNEAKLNLSKTTNDLAGIRSSVKCLNKKMRNERMLIGKMSENSAKREIQIPEQDFESEQFEKMEEAARYEVMKATSDIEQTKKSIRMVEMRLIAAKKMEEAARAMEAVSVAEKKSYKNPEEITISYEEYSDLKQKAQNSEQQIQNKISDSNFIRQKKSLQEALCKEDCGDQMRCPPMFKYRNSRRSQPLDQDNSSVPVWRSTISIGDILTRKLIVQDHIVEGNMKREEVSLSEMLREQSGLILHPPTNNKSTKDANNVDKHQFFSQRKKFGFIHVSLPLTRQSKKKNQPLNQR